MVRSTSPWALAALSPLLLLEFLNLISDRLGTDPLLVINSGSGIGPGKSILLLIWVLIVTVAGCVHIWLRSGRPIVSIILLSGIGIGAAGLTLAAARDDHFSYRASSFYTVNASLQRLVISHLPFPTVTTTASDLKHVGTFPDLFRYLDSQYEQMAPQLISWPVDEKMRRLLHHAATLAALWPYGTLEGSGRGCVMSQPANEFGRTAPELATVGYYLSSKVACCTDLTVLMAGYLEWAGINYRSVAIAGHSFVEAELDGKWRMIDATTAIAIDSSWESAVAKEARPVVYVLPHPGELHGHPFYRPNLARFRLALLARLGYAPFDVARMVEPAGYHQYGSILEQPPYLEQMRAEISTR